MVYFQIKIPNLGTFGGSWNGKCWSIFGHLVYFTAIWSISLPFGLFHSHLVYFTAIWSISLPFVGILLVNLATLPEISFFKGRLHR
jgi:hypothetical protein